MKLKNIRIEKGTTSRLCMDVEYNQTMTTLWFEVDNKFGKYLCDELADSFLCALLFFAMEHNENIEVVGVPASDILLFNLKNYFIPTISKNIKKYHQIDIICQGSNLQFDSKRYNGTGISRGIDSFYTLDEFTNKCPEDMKIDYLTFFNIGAHGEYDSNKAYPLYEKRMQSSKKFADNYGFKFLNVNTNISDFLLQDFEATHTLRNVSIVFALQKLLKNYYYSSGISIEKFKISEKDPAYYDVYTMYLLSTNNVRFFSSGTALNRLEKTKVVATYKPSYKNLSVCFMDDCNCGKCEKCIRTIFEFYACGNLDKYSEAFDLKYFYDNINWYERKFFEYYFLFDEELFYKSAYNEMKKNNIKMKKINMMKGFCVAMYHKFRHFCGSTLKKIYHTIKK